MASVRRKVRSVVLAPVRLCRALARAVVGGIVGAVVGTGRLFVAGLHAVGRGVAGAFGFAVQTFVRAVGAGFGLAWSAGTRVSLAVGALARAVVSRIVGAAAGAGRAFIARLQAMGRAIAIAFALAVRKAVHSVRTGAAAFALILDGIARAARAAVALGVSTMAVGRGAFVSGAHTLTARTASWAGLVRREARRGGRAVTRASMNVAGLIGVAVAAATTAGIAALNRDARARRPKELWAAAVVVALVVAVVTAGGVLQLSRGPGAQPVAAVVRIEAPAQPVVVPAAAAVTRPDAGARPTTRRATATTAPPPATRRAPALERTPARAAAVTTPEPRVERTLNADTVRAIWRNADTRSLDRGIAAVRTATLALHRCTVQITATDRAVAHCDVQPPATDDSAPPRNAAWTIDFRRADERWLIDDISAPSR